MASLTAVGIETLPLDIQSSTSIEDCAKKIPRLDILVNNAGASYTMPITDISIPEAKELFDINVWGHMAMTQAFLPPLLKSPKAIVVNHTSTGVHLSIPFQSVYNASKAAMSRFSDTLRLELQPFGIAVVELKTGGVKTNVVNNVRAKQPELPESSIYQPAKDQVEKALRCEYFEKHEHHVHRRAMGQRSRSRSVEEIPSAGHLERTVGMAGAARNVLSFRVVGWIRSKNDWA